MVGLNPDESFIPDVENEFGPTEVIVVKDALSGQPIRRWFKAWKDSNGAAPESTGDLYDRLMARVDSAVAGVSLQSISFLWMQGERDAREQHGEVYTASLYGLLDQVGTDLGRTDINFVIGRLSDYDLNDERYPHWTMIRSIQVEVADSYSRGAWVDTDDLNDGMNRAGNEIHNDLHYSADGYLILGQRFAQKAIDLINR